MSELVQELERLRAEATEAIEDASDPDALREAEVRYLGRKARLNEILRGLRDLPDDEKREVGPAGNRLRGALEALVERRRETLERRAEEELLGSDRLDLTLPGRTPPRGGQNPLRIVAEAIEDVFVGLGYEIAEGPEVETDWHNFQALNIPLDHPARSDMDTFFVRGPRGPQQALLRTHTSPVQIRVMQAAEPPIFVICPGRVFRRDTPDATHSPIFHQVEGLAVAEGLTLADLKGTLQAFAEGAFGPDRHIRLAPSFFPFTEPSAELAVDCPLCDGHGCNQCDEGWLEIGGAGMVDPNVFEAVGIDPERYTGFAFGMSVERPAMLRYGVDDLRLFFEGEQRFLEQFRGVPVGA